jgi:hypothetical protein
VFFPVEKQAGRLWKVKNYTYVGELNASTIRLKPTNKHQGGDAYASFNLLVTMRQLEEFY